jgi:hypothetical protein
MRIWQPLISLLLVLFCFIPAHSQNKLNPIETTKEFYRLLREKKYAEGFRLSVYREAIEALSKDELQELTPEFENTLSRIPEDIKVLGSQTNGQHSTVFIKANDNPGDTTAEEVFLLKVNDQWLVGDEETQTLVKALGKKFFFEIRIRVNEESVEQLMSRYLGAEKLYFDANKGVYGTTEDLVKANFWPQGYRDGQVYGYQFTVELGKDKKDFSIHAEPLTYNKTGRLSFYADTNGVRKLDNQGKTYRLKLDDKTNK